ncbi:MAG TPA: endo-1,4-beta-xylanase [Povalibacter sp.]
MNHFSRRQFTLNGAALLALGTLKTRAIHAAASQTGIKDAYAGDFLIGTAVSNNTLETGNPPLLELIAREFNAVTPENCMKWGVIEPREGDWHWTLPDRLVDYAVKHQMHVVGHTLVWHSQTPPWLFVDESGKAISAERLNKRIDQHIQVLVNRYRGKVSTWDVVNEAIDEDDKGWRKSPLFNIAGPGFMERAFRAAHEADPTARLLYNDYNEHNPGRRNFLVELIKDYRRRGVPIHGTGFQGHVGLDYPDLGEYEKSIEAMANAGMRVSITEMDVDVLPRAWQFTGAEISALVEYSAQLNPYTKGLPAQMEAQLAARYRQLFELFLRHRDKIDRVTMWGTHDGESWKNDFPVRGRTNYPLLFNRQLQPKAAYEGLISLKGAKQASAIR